MKKKLPWHFRLLGFWIGFSWAASCFCGNLWAQSEDAQGDSIVSEESSFRRSVQPGRPRWWPDKKWQAGVGVLFASGDFGTDVTTRFLTVGFSASRLFKKGDITLTVPYLHVSTDKSVTLLLDAIPERAGDVSPQRFKEDGLGDLSLEGRYYLREEKKLDLFPTVALAGKIKFPTADKDVGLGTGEFDEKITLELSKELFPKVLGYFDIGYNFIGDPSGINLRNDQWEYTPGLGYLFTNRLAGFVLYQESRALVSGVTNPRHLQLAVAYWLRPRQVLILGGGLVGLSDGAPDYGVGSNVSVQF